MKEKLENINPLHIHHVTQIDDVCVIDRGGWNHNCIVENVTKEEVTSYQQNEISKRAKEDAQKGRGIFGS